ncbi:hypothetical protein HK405_015997, partial [Cladochytrium tenue]
MSSPPSVPAVAATAAAGKALVEAASPGAQMASTTPLEVGAASGASSPPQLLRLLVQQQLLFEGQVELERQFLRIQMLRQMHALQMQRLTAQTQLDSVPASRQDRQPNLEAQSATRGPADTGSSGPTSASQRDKSAPPSTDR